MRVPLSAKSRAMHFQRETLLELQQAMLRLTHSTNLLHIHHRTIYAANGTYAREADPPGMTEEHREAMVDTARLRQRVLDDELPQRVQDVRSLCTQITSPPQATEETDEQAAQRADQQVLRLAHEYSDLEDHLGDVLRAVL